MREIKYRYIVTEPAKNITHRLYHTLEGIERLDPNHQIFKPSYKIVARDLYTGLKDKNGVEIYEGDVVKAFEKPYDDFPRNNEVVLSLGSFKLRCIRPVGSDNAKFDYEFVSDIPIFNYHETSLEVIGNIYEHPHLLEVSE